MRVPTSGDAVAQFFISQQTQTFKRTLSFGVSWEYNAATRRLTFICASIYLANALKLHRPEIVNPLGLDIEIVTRPDCLIPVQRREEL